ncbi:hypothetical protein KM043_015793 [Ampulex compressa]|nr:hypothetical protein KM043_015793 [Ampulex compressa]
MSIGEADFINGIIENILDVMMRDPELECSASRQSRCLARIQEHDTAAAFKKQEKKQSNGKPHRYDQIVVGICSVRITNYVREHEPLQHHKQLNLHESAVSKFAVSAHDCGCHLVRTLPLLASFNKFGTRKNELSVRKCPGIKKRMSLIAQGRQSPRVQVSHDQTKWLFMLQMLASDRPLK